MQPKTCWMNRDTELRETPREHDVAVYSADDPAIVFALSLASLVEGQYRNAADRSIDSHSQLHSLPATIPNVDDDTEALMIACMERDLLRQDALHAIAKDRELAWKAGQLAKFDYDLTMSLRTAIARADDEKSAERPKIVLAKDPRDFGRNGREL